MMKNNINVTVAAQVLSQCCVNRFIFYWCLLGGSYSAQECGRLLVLCLCMFCLNGGGNLPPRAQKEKEKLNQTKSCILLFSQPSVLFTNIYLP